MAAIIGRGTATIHDVIPTLARAARLAVAFWRLDEGARRRFPPGKHDVLLPKLFTPGVGRLVGLPLAIGLFAAVRASRSVFDLHR